MYAIALPSETTGLLNFLVCEILLFAYVLYISAFIAGALNHAHLRAGRALSLTVFDVPHIGGGLVMNRSRARLALIFFRLTTLAAIATSNFGLEGRSRSSTERREVMMRRPATLPDLNTAKLFNATKLRIDCARRAWEEQLVFGAVIDGQCYPDVKDNVYVSSVALTYTSFNASGKHCAVSTHEDLRYTVYHCRHIDISCPGVYYGKENVERGRCSSVIYAGNHSWMCAEQSLRPFVGEQTVKCRRLGTRWSYIQQWTTIFRNHTVDLETAIFAAAYGVEERRVVDVPVEQRVTVVSLFYVVPVAYELAVVVWLSLWAARLAWAGGRSVAHDERGLARVVQRAVRVESLSVADWMQDDKGEGNEATVGVERNVNDVKGWERDGETMRW